jgi:predicted TIM-barrel fold metal-dependent hydrolase
VLVDGVIDCCVFHEWASPLTLAPYLSAGWAELVRRPGDKGGPVNFQSQWLYSNPLGNKSGAAVIDPISGVPGSDFETLSAQLLRGNLRDRIVLGYDDGLLATAFPNHYLAREVVRAANDWTSNEWLSRDHRLYGLVLISSSLPDDAAAEIRRAGRNDRMVGVALGANALGLPFGHPIYHPIYRAASEMGLPIVLQVGSDASADLMTPPVAGGLPATYAEYWTLGGHSLMSHVSAMIVQGVFELFPDLKLLLLGGGASWLPGYLWRLDYWYKTDEQEAPWLRKLPSDYFRDNIRVTTYSLESPPKAEQLWAALKTLPWFESNLMFASGYPNADWEEPGAIAKRTPSAWHPALFRANALNFFRWPKEIGSSTATEAGDSK